MLRDNYNIKNKLESLPSGGQLAKKCFYLLVNHLKGFQTFSNLPFYATKYGFKNPLLQSISFVSCLKEDRNKIQFVWNPLPHET